jgi:glycosyltransferase involved in cell wall biosynthesis
MRPARVLHVFKYFRPRFTGEGVFVERLAPVFARLRPEVRHEVLVLATPRPDAPPALPGLDAIHYLSRAEGDASQADLIAWLAGHARRYSVVHHRTHVDRTFAGAAALKLQGVKLLLSATLDDSVEGLLATYRPALRPLAARLFPLIDRFVAISPRLHAENQRHVPPARCELVPMGIPLPKLEPDRQARARRRLGLAQDAAVLVCVGGLCRRKDQLLLLRQVAALVAARPELVLLLVGPAIEPDYEAELRAFVAAHGLEANVRFEGRIEQPWTHYEAADVFVFASRQEGFGTVMIEAMAHGLPVVARALPGINDSFLDHGRTGFLFEDERQLGPLLAPLLENPALRDRVGEAARARVAAEYDIEAIAARYLQLYGYPAGARSPAAPLQRHMPFGSDAGVTSANDRPEIASV